MYRDEGLTWLGIFVLIGFAQQLGLFQAALILLVRAAEITILFFCKAPEGDKAFATAVSSYETPEPIKPAPGPLRLAETDVTVKALLEQLAAKDRELKQLWEAKQERRRLEDQITALQAKLDQYKLQDRELTELRFQVRALSQRLSTTNDIPEGKLAIRGRLVTADKHLAIIPYKGKPFRVLKAIGWENALAGETGDEVLLEAIMNEQGWTAWKVIVEQPSCNLPPLEKSLVEKLSASKEKKPTPDFNQLDLEAAQNPTRTASHSKTAITLHIVLPTHARFSLTPEQAEDIKQIVVGLVTELDMGIVSAIEVGHTEGGNQRDHLHLLVSAFNHTANSIGHQVGRLKALSSGRLRRKHPGLKEKLWSASYWISSAGGSLDKVRDYINDNADKNADGDSE